MKTSKLAKRIFTYLTLLALVVVVVAGMLMFISRGLRQTSLESQAKTATQLTIEQINPELLADFGAGGSCVSAYIYLSLPPKCRTADGEFVPFSGIPSFVIIGPGPK